MNNNEIYEDESDVNVEFTQRYIILFIGREDLYGKEELTYSKKRCVEQVAEPLTEDIIREHFEGKILWMDKMESRE